MIQQPWSKVCFFISVANECCRAAAATGPSGKIQSTVLLATCHSTTCCAPPRAAWVGRGLSGLSHHGKASRSPYLAQKPRVVLGESRPVGVWGDSGILETVLDGRGCTDILIQELLPRLLRDGFGWHGYLIWIKKKKNTKKKQSGTESSSHRELPIT